MHQQQNPRCEEENEITGSSLVMLFTGGRVSFACISVPRMTESNGSIEHFYNVFDTQTRCCLRSNQAFCSFGLFSKCWHRNLHIRPYDDEFVSHVNQWAGLVPPKDGATHYRRTRYADEGLFNSVDTDMES